MVHIFYYLLSISKESFILFFRHIHIFILFLMPLALIQFTLDYQGFTKVTIFGLESLGTVLEMLFSAFMSLLSVVLADRIIYKRSWDVGPVMVDVIKNAPAFILFNIFIALLGLLTFIIAMIVSRIDFIGTSLFLAIFAGFIYVFTRYVLAVVIIVVEKKGFLSSMMRSKELIEGFSWLVGSMIVWLVLIDFAIIFIIANFKEQFLLISYSIAGPLLLQISLIHFFVFYKRRVTEA